jgi:thioredoxin-dependent peroxiredoxin
MLNENEKAPDFSLMGSDGKKHTLRDFKGKNLVLYFYPKDDTTGCTIEAKCFNARMGEIRANDAVVVGVSSDDLESHDKFISKYDLDFLLLSDPKNETIKEYDSYGNKGAFGWGTIRNTFIIGKDGRILKIFKRVKAEGHDRQVLEFLRAMT